MGWSSGGEIFDPIAKALIDARIDDATVTNILANLIDKLTDEDWDTLDASIQAFRDQPAVMAAFQRAAPDWMPDGYEPPAGPVAPGGPTITLLLYVEGETTVEVDRAEYEAAKAAGVVDHFLDVYLSDLDSTKYVVEPGGGEYAPSDDPFGLSATKGGR